MAFTISVSGSASERYTGDDFEHDDGRLESLDPLGPAERAR